jgi:YVTN family beta-propeller protein
MNAKRSRNSWTHRILLLVAAGLGLLGAERGTAQSLLATIPIEETADRMAITPDGARVYAVGRLNNNVTVIDTGLDAVQTVIPRAGFREPGDWPDDIVVSPDGARVYVVSGSLDRLTAIDRASNTIVADLPIGDNPSSVVVTPNGGKIYVANAGFPNNVAVVDSATLAILATIPASTVALPGTMAVHPAGSRVYVIGATGVSVIDTVTDSVVATIPTSGFRLALHPDGSRLYVHNQFANRIEVFDTATHLPIALVPVAASGADPEVIVTTSDGGRVLATHFAASSVSVIDAATNAVLANIPFPPFPSNPVGLATSPDGSTAFIASQNSLSWLSMATHTITATLPVASGGGSASESLLITPDSAKLYATCGTAVCVFGTGIVTTRTIEIDVRPHGEQNRINPRSRGVVRVAILGEPGFDVRQVDVATVRFGVNGTEAAPRREAAGNPNRDGERDLVLQFEIEDTGIVCGTEVVRLTGALLDKQKIAGSDSIRTTGCR